VSSVPLGLARLSPASVWWTGEQAQVLRCHADRLALTLEAHIEHVRASANDFAVLV
jgi:hypothetical protein